MTRGLTITQQRGLQISGRSLARTVIPDSEGLHEWLMDEGSGSTAEDRIANADLGLNGSVSWVSGVGIGDYAVNLDGTDTEAVVSSGDLLDWGDSGSMMVQIAPREDGERNDVWFHQTNDDRMYCFLRGDLPGNEIEVGVGDTGTDSSHGLTISDLNMDDWNGICLTWDSGSYSLHLYDFANETLTSGSGSYSVSLKQNGELQIGNGGKGDNFDGRLDYPRLFDLELSQSEVVGKFEEIAAVYK